MNPPTELGWVLTRPEMMRLAQRTMDLEDFKWKRTEICALMFSRQDEQEMGIRLDLGEGDAFRLVMSQGPAHSAFMEFAAYEADAFIRMKYEQLSAHFPAKGKRPNHRVEFTKKWMAQTNALMLTRDPGDKTVATIRIPLDDAAEPVTFNGQRVDSGDVVLMTQQVERLQLDRHMSVQQRIDAMGFSLPRYAENVD